MGLGSGLSQGWTGEHLWKVVLVALTLLAGCLLLLLLYTAVAADVYGDNARYLLSAIVQSEAAIIAVVVSLSLVAVQLASGHSPRMMALFRQSRSLWLLLLLYIASMLITLAVLGTVGGHVLVLVWGDTFVLRGVPPVQWGVALAYALAAACFIALVPYIYSMLGMLSPSRLIGALASEITPERTVDYVRSLWGHEGTPAEVFERVGKWGDDPFQPLVDMVSSSMMRYDHATARDGVDAIVDKVETLLEEGSIEENYKEDIAMQVWYHLNELGMLAARLESNAALIGVADALRAIGKMAVKKKFRDTAYWVVEALGNIGERAAEKNLVWAAGRAAGALGGCKQGSIPSRRHRIHSNKE